MKKKIMKTGVFIFALGFLLSCSPEEDSGFTVELSDGSVIQEPDIAFYDSSTCILFLEEDLNIMYASGEPPGVVFTEFTVLVNSEKIYEGIIYPDIVAAPSPVPFFIASSTYPDMESSIIQIKHLGFFTETDDVRNDQRIINSLNKSSLLNHGLTTIIDDVQYSQQDDSTLICSVTITNHDQISYYIPDPLKMGHGHFNYYTGGLRLIQKASNEYFYPDYGDATTDWNYLELDDLSIIEGNSTISFTFKSSYDTSIEEGAYECRLWYGNLRHLYTFNLELNQPAGRIWVGESESNIDFTLIAMTNKVRKLNI